MVFVFLYVIFVTPFISMSATASCVTNVKNIYIIIFVKGTDSTVNGNEGCERQS